MRHIPSSLRIPTFFHKQAELNTTSHTTASTAIFLIFLSSLATYGQNSAGKFSETAR